MNKTEQKALGWIVSTTGFRAEDIKYYPSQKSPH